MLHIDFADHRLSRWIGRLLCRIFGHPKPSKNAIQQFDRCTNLSTYQKQEGQCFRIYQATYYCNRCRKQKHQEIIKIPVDSPSTNAAMYSRDIGPWNE